MAEQNPEVPRDQDPNIPHYNVTSKGRDKRLLRHGKEMLARYVRVAPSLHPSEDQFEIVETDHDVTIMPLHEVAGDLALLFVFHAFEPDAKERLDAAMEHLGRIANIDEDPEAGIEALFPPSSSEIPEPFLDAR